MAIFRLNINGETRSVDVDPVTPLLYVLTDDLGLRGPKFGCGLGQCGACTVISDGRAIRSCVTRVDLVAGTELTSLEGLGSVDQPHPVQEAFIGEQAAQCGFCMNGVILTGKAYLDQNPEATDDELRQALATVLCRCGSHTRIFRALRRYAEEVNA
jgi:nicotinate dehydrogenase subunit A